MDWTALAREALAFSDLARLRRDPIYRGDGLKRGDGRLVAIIPGLFAGDWYLWPLRRWISRIGFHASASGLWLNAGCPDRLTSEVRAWIDRRQPRARKIVLIGHSRGGILARALAVRFGPRISHLITLGSPVGVALAYAQPSARGPIPHETMNALARASNAARALLDPNCRFPECGCEFARNLAQPTAPETVVLSIYSREDPIVPPEASIVAGARNLEVTGSHTGLVYNPAVYREIAAALGLA